MIKKIIIIIIINFITMDTPQGMIQSVSKLDRTKSLRLDK